MLVLDPGVESGCCQLVSEEAIVLSSQSLCVMFTWSNYLSSSEFTVAFLDQGFVFV